MSQYIVVVNREGSQERPTIHRSENLSTALKNARRFWSNAQERDFWTPEMDERLLQLYRTMPKDQLAVLLGKEFGRTFGKGAVIGRYHRILERDRLK